jgi:hypothetical protein
MDRKAIIGALAGYLFTRTNWEMASCVRAAEEMLTLIERLQPLSQESSSTKDTIAAVAAQIAAQAGASAALPAAAPIVVPLPPATGGTP